MMSQQLSITSDPFQTLDLHQTPINKFYETLFCPVGKQAPLITIFHSPSHYDVENPRNL